eukprot:s702_g53.t1
MFVRLTSKFLADGKICPKMRHIENCLLEPEPCFRRNPVVLDVVVSIHFSWILFVTALSTANVLDGLVLLVPQRARFCLTDHLSFTSIAVWGGSKIELLPNG